PRGPPRCTGSGGHRNAPGAADGAADARQRRVLVPPALARRRGARRAPARGAPPAARGGGGLGRRAGPRGGGLRGGACGRGRGGAPRCRAGGPAARRRLPRPRPSRQRPARLGLPGGAARCPTPGHGGAAAGGGGGGGPGGTGPPGTSVLSGSAREAYAEKRRGWTRQRGTIVVRSRQPRGGTVMNTEVPTEHRTIPYDPAARDLGVVVGFDGSPNSEKALDHGAAVAARRGSPLTVVITYKVAVPVYPNYASIPPPSEIDARKRDAESVLEA